VGNFIEKLVRLIIYGLGAVFILLMALNYIVRVASGRDSPSRGIVIDYLFY
jgi:hypothetical protein